MKFIIPKLNTPYRVLEDIEVELWSLDSESWKKMNKRGVDPRSRFTITSGSIIKIMNWDYKRKNVKIRTVTLADKRFEKISGYVHNPDDTDWIETLDVEEITV